MLGSRGKHWGAPRRELLIREGVDSGRLEEPRGSSRPGGAAGEGDAACAGTVVSGVGPGELSMCRAQDFGLEHGSPISGMSLNILLLSAQLCRDLVLCPGSVILRPENLGKAELVTGVGLDSLPAREWPFSLNLWCWWGDSQGQPLRSLWATNF